MNLSNIPQSSPLSNYNRSQADKTFADADETLLGHLVLEQGLALQDALENLRPHVKQARTATQLATDWTGKIGFGSIAVGVLLGTSIGAPLAIPPLLAGCLSLKFWGDSRNEKPRRDAEYRLLRDVVPQLPEFLWGLHLKGCSAMEIIGAYDGLVGAIESAIESGKAVEEKDVSAYLWHKIEAGRNFQGTLTQDQDGEPEKLPQTQLEQPKDQGQDQDASPQQQPESLAPSGSQQAAARPSQQSPIAFLADDPKSQMVIGVTGGGKDFLMSNALRLLLQKYPSFSVLVMDGKGDPKEAGYYAGLPGVTVRSLRILESTPEDATEWINACIDEFQGLTAPKLLVINEGTAIRGFPSKYPDFAVHVASGGDSSAIYCWEAGQIAHTSALKIDGGRRSLFAPIALISKRRPDQVDALLATGFTPKELKTQAFEAMDSSPVGRAWFDGRRWQPMPRLENFSGYDRDDLAQKFAKREPTGTPKATSQVEQLERLYRESPALDAPIEPTGNDTDPIEADILALLKSRHPEGLTAGRIRADKKSLKSVDLGEIEFYLEVLLEEGKIRREGNLFYYK